MSADEWARDIEARMTDDERFTLLHGVMPIFGRPESFGPDVVPSAGYVPGVPRLGVPSLRESDASLGVTNPFNARPGDGATAFPSTLALGASFDVELARKAGEIIGKEARAKGINVMLAGGINLARDPRNGRNFEYVSEDPLLSGMIGGAAVAGIQSQQVISTVKHLALNFQETNRMTANAVIGMAAMRESDLLAFEIAIEQGRPGSVMGAYNLVNGEHCCGSTTLLNSVLKEAWGYPGFVMSDWRAVTSWDYAVKGLDQQSAGQLDEQVWFDTPLRDAEARGDVSRERISDMVRRILRAMKAVGVTEWSGPQQKANESEGDAVALQVAREGIVLLKNAGVLPLKRDVKTIAVIGGKARAGVLSGGGSSQVTPNDGFAATVPLGGDGVMGAQRMERWFADAPFFQIAGQVSAQVFFDAGLYPEDGAALAKRCDVAIVFVTRHEMEGFDVPSLSLPSGQDALVAAVAEANPNTVVVIEAGNPIAMPWIDGVNAVLHAWYPGQRGGQAIAEVLSGAVNPSGRAPMTFPQDISQTPRPELPGFGEPSPDEKTVMDIPVIEGADVGYRWFAKNGLQPLFPFGHGLSYTTFSHGDLTVTGGDTISATFTVTNTGQVEGADVAQLYLVDAAGTKTKRLIGFARVNLKPGESRELSVEADPRLLANYDDKAGCWTIKGGAYTVTLARDASDSGIVAQATLKARTFGK